jgi:hypothetical protein
MSRRTHGIARELQWSRIFVLPFLDTHQLYSQLLVTEPFISIFIPNGYGCLGNLVSSEPQNRRVSRNFEPPPYGKRVASFPNLAVAQCQGSQRATFLWSLLRFGGVGRRKSLIRAAPRTAARRITSGRRGDDMMGTALSRNPRGVDLPLRPRRKCTA